jgi:hypothetical protein
MFWIICVSHLSVHPLPTINPQIRQYTVLQTTDEPVALCWRIS